MKAIAIFIGAFIAMYIDMSFSNFSPFYMFGLEVYFVPRILLMYVLLLAIYVSPIMGIFIAVIFGLMVDIYIGSIYGVHVFGLVTAVVFMRAAFRVFDEDFIAMAFVILTLTFFYDIYVYLIYRILVLTTFPIFDYFALRATPSLLINALFFTGVYLVTLKISKLREDLRT